LDGGGINIVIVGIVIVVLAVGFLANEHRKRTGKIKLDDENHYGKKIQEVNEEERAKLLKLGIDPDRKGLARDYFAITDIYREAFSDLDKNKPAGKKKKDKKEDK